jgi:hypothetical protein
MQICRLGQNYLYLKSGGNVGIGTTNPSTRLTVRNDSGNVDNYILEIGNDLHATNTKDAWLKYVGGAATNDHSWTTGIISDSYRIVQLGARATAPSSGTERMRIHSDGDTTIGTASSTANFYNGAGSETGHGFHPTGYGCHVRGGVLTPLYVSTSGTGNTRFIEFYNGTTVRGGINWNGSTLSVTTGSDYRLKENIAPIQNALTRINTLNPISYDMIDTGVSGEGFLAHEAQTVVPYAVIGEKDELYEADNVPEEKEDQIGQPKYQMMDYAKLTPLLVKAIQEQQTIIDDLKSRIEALEE